jgi:hypothetical protein
VGVRCVFFVAVYFFLDPAVVGGVLRFFSWLSIFFWTPQ